MSDLISRRVAIDAVCEHGTDLERRGITVLSVANHKQATVDLLEQLPSAQPEQRLLAEDDYACCAQIDPEVKCLSCGHHIAERPFEVYCNIMCKWVNEKDYCTMFEPRQGKMRKTEA